MRLPFNIRLVGTFLALSAACGGQKPAAQSAESTQTDGAAKPRVDIAALLAAEIEPQPLQPVAPADGSFKATLEASSPPEITPEDGFTMVQTRLGKAPVLCFVYLDSRDIGGLVGHMAETSFGDGRRHEWVDVHGDHVADAAYVIGRAHYLGENGMLGDLKVAASASSAASVMCMHDGPGNYASFERAMRGFIGSLEVAEQTAPAPRETSITRAQIPGKMVTITRSFALVEGKEKVSHSYSSTLALGENGALGIAEDGSMETFEKGTLKRGRYMSADGGQLKYKIELERDRKTYKVSGTLADEPFASEFPVDPAGYLDAEREAAQLCKVRDGKLPRFTLVDYDPDSDPLHPSTGIYEKNDSADGDLKFKVEGSQGAEMFMRLDEACERVGATLKAGGLTVQIERIYHEKSKS